MWIFLKNRLMHLKYKLKWIPFFSAFFLFSGSAQAWFISLSNPLSLFDVSFFQGNLGWANYSASDEMSNPFNSNLNSNEKFQGSGLHAALSVVDLNRVDYILIGGRFGGQVFSNANNTISVPTYDFNNLPLVQTYTLKREEGVFVDFMLVKPAQEQPMYGYAFGGLGYDKYTMKGFQQIADGGLPSQIRQSSTWVFGGRAGGGLGFRFLGNYALGLEYTYFFGQNFTLNAGTYNFPGEDRRHAISSDGNMIDATFSVLIGTT